MNRVSVLGLGNVLMGDDGVGPYLTRLLEASYEFATGVSVLDAGTPGFDMLPRLLELDALILVDTVKAAGEPGELRFYRKEQILNFADLPRTSPHQPTVRESLLTAELHGEGPREVLLIGVIPQKVDAGTSLSEPVRASLPLMERAVLDELNRLGCRAKEREHPRRLDIWWQKPEAGEGGGTEARTGLHA